MYHPTPTGLALRMGMLLLMSILLLVMACGAPEEAKPRPLPEDTRKLSPGTYRSEEFEPSFSFKVGEGWTNLPPEMPDNLALVWGQTGFLRFFKAQEVSKPTERYEVVDAPKDLVGWLRRHPHLRTSTPEPVEVGGIKGERLDVVVGDLPEDHVGACGPDCVDLFRLSDGSALGAGKGFKYRAIVLEDVKGETVIIGFGGPAGEFSGFAPEAHKVLDGVQWRGE
jgi:hypothetical protein